MAEKFELKTKAEFKIGQIVYLLTDPYQCRRIVVGILLTDHHPIYVLKAGTDQVTEHSAPELTLIRDMEFLKETQEEDRRNDIL